MPVLIAPDKFKGTLAAPRAAAEIEAGLRAAGFAGPLRRLPVADGGEGTAEALLEARGGTVLERPAHDPLGRGLTARLALLGDGDTAVVEAAAASGLDLLDQRELDAERASSHGTGELIRAALAAGARTVLVAAGGSAMTDGGRGALEALGFRFDLEAGRVSRPHLGAARFEVLCDVDVPLLGPDGAATAFSPQKGASEAAVGGLEERLRRWGAFAAEAAGRDPRELPMAGAAGGLAAGLWSFLGAELRPGADYVLDAVGFAKRLPEATAVVTGEGAIDATTLRGKAVGRIAKRCVRAGVPCLAIVGADRLAPGAAQDLGLRVRVAAPGRVAAAGDLRRAAGAEAGWLGEATAGA